LFLEVPSIAWFGVCAGVLLLIPIFTLICHFWTNNIISTPFEWCSFLTGNQFLIAPVIYSKMLFFFLIVAGSIKVSRTQILLCLAA
jgi:hypothetical protein